MCPCGSVCFVGSTLFLSSEEETCPRMTRMHTDAEENDRTGRSGSATYAAAEAGRFWVVVVKHETIRVPVSHSAV